MYKELIQVPNPPAGTQIRCASTGGMITYTKTGLIHTSGKAYSGLTAEQELLTKSK